MSEQEQALRATISLTQEYLLEAWERDPRRHRPSWRMTWAFGAGCGFAIALLIWLIDLRNREGAWWMVIPIGLLGGGLYVYWTSPAGQRRGIESSIRKSVTNPPARQEFEFAPDGFKCAVAGGAATFYPWPSVPRVVQRPDGVLIYFNNYHFFWVPEKVFAKPQHYAAVLKWIAGKAPVVDRLEP